ncbi:chromosomal replication initiator protein DnaA [Candidatus Peribacteria bacterium]|nr:chromosomal replication initiator protein DnaA [Candidatus Peribacteria bacterium]MBT4021311.1 chromosomal replication initiator protein DnaA [Candidatus Peribacteria bacterium]MBT4241228.1 chromosomal replication initiator protein DnaA [Candidatus Peribacteria bacterium]MBT4474253.1 chromosomal replication initiator protein DnaA [Candidatus Peribacteria bacterium]
MSQAKSMWVSILGKLESEIQRPMLITWFKDTAILGKEDNNLIVGLPLPMFLNWHLEHYREPTLKAAREIDSSVEKIVYKVDLSLRDDEMRTVDLIGVSPAKKRRKLPNKPEVKIAEGLRSKMLNPKYSLNNFVVGGSNRLAHAAAIAVAAQPGGKYNPFFIYGGVGLGKTHLLQAIGNGVLGSNPEATVLYTTSEEFTNQVIEAIKHQKMEQLRRRFRQVDTLIIDDIQFFAGKERTQEEFFHTFNTLLESGRQVIISSDRSPKDLHALPDRLKSRFERGMVADVRMPDYETRVAILNDRAKEYELFLDQKVMAFIAEHVTDSVRTLEGVLMQVFAQYELEHQMPTLSSVVNILKKLSRDPSEISEDIGFEQPVARAARLEDILESVSKYYSVSIQDMIGTSRMRNIMIPRQIAMYIGKKYLNMSLVQLGERFSNRDHSTVLHAIKKIEKEIQKDPDMIREINAIEKDVGVKK